MLDTDSVTELRQKGYRLTPQRLAVFSILAEAGQHLSPVDVYRRAQQRLPGINEATVYRALSFLTEQGLVHAAHLGGGQVVYEVAEHEHHHLLCRSCGESVEIEHRLMEAIYEELEQITGYQIDSVHLTFFGRCAACLAPEEPRRQGPS